MNINTPTIITLSSALKTAKTMTERNALAYNFLKTFTLFVDAPNIY